MLISTILSFVYISSKYDQQLGHKKFGLGVVGLNLERVFSDQKNEDQIIFKSNSYVKKFQGEILRYCNRKTNYPNYLHTNQTRKEK